MREDYTYNSTIDRAEAQRRARCKSKRVLVGAASGVSFLCGVWKAGLALLGLLVLVNLVQKTKKETY